MQLPAVSHQYVATLTKSLAFLQDTTWNEQEMSEKPDVAPNSYSPATQPFLYHRLCAVKKPFHGSAAGQIWLPSSLPAWIWFADFSSMNSLLTTTGRTRTRVFNSTTSKVSEIENFVPGQKSAQFRRELLLKLIHPFSLELQSRSTHPFYSHSLQEGKRFLQLIPTAM